MISKFVTYRYTISNLLVYNIFYYEFKAHRFVSNILLSSCQSLEDILPQIFLNGYLNDY